MLKTKCSVRVCTRKTVRGLGLVLLSLVLFCIVAQSLRFIGGYTRAMGFIPQFALGMEHNVPTFFSSMLLLSAAALLGIITMTRHQHKESKVFQWGLLAVIFLYLAVDEAAGLHELLNYPVSIFTETGSVFYYGWVIPASVLVLIFAGAYLRFLLDLPRTVRILFVAAGMLYVGGALGGEMVSGLYADSHGWDNPTYATIATMEETLEMTGALVFVYALLRYVRAEVRELRITFA